MLRPDPIPLPWHSYFLQQNHEGSVTHLTDASGNVIEKYRYDAFGVPTIYAPDWSVRSSTSYDNRFLFTGREYAATYRSTNTGFNFYEYRARAYNPALGRFMSEDPKLFGAGDYNLFRYCHNDPIDRTDPMGLIAIADAPITNPDIQAQYTKALDSSYNYIMSAAQWAGSNLLHAVGGAGGIGMAGYQAMGELSLTLASMTTAYPVSRANTNPHPSIIKSSADPNGLVHIDSGQRTAFQDGLQIVKANTDSSEAIIGITYNATTHQYGVTPTIARGHEFQGGQTSQLPPLPRGNYAYAGQVHSHTNRSGFSGPDILWGNQNRLPIGLYSGNRSQLYVPLFNANPNSSSLHGAILPFGD